MSYIQSLLLEYQGKIDFLDLELIITHVIKKSREFVLTHPEYKLVKSQKSKVKSYLLRRMKHEPLAFILGEKEFYGIKFKVNKNTLIPRPETEQIVELVTRNVKRKIESEKIKIIDIGTGSGNIIISIAKQLKNFEFRILNFEFLGIDISKKALAVAKYNAKLNRVDKKINFLQGNLLEPIIKKRSMFHVPCSMIVTANLPYLSKEIYNSCSKDIKNYEPKSALISQKEGLMHYEELLKQLKELRENCNLLPVTCYMEISPEQKMKIFKLIKKYFPETKIIFHKDLSGRWRICEILIQNAKIKNKNCS